ncbi:MAG: hypothetical protein Q7J84_00900 [Sulfuricaulis sp.]|nr:hypothetical protein [Sulfuricaulis sp.]
MNLIGADIGQFAASDIEEVVVWIGIRIVKNSVGIGNHCPDHAFIGKEAQGVVNRRLGYPAVFRIHQAKNILGGKMGAMGEQDTGDYYPLRSRVYVMAAQQFDDIRIWFQFKGYVHLELL